MAFHSQFVMSLRIGLMNKYIVSTTFENVEIEADWYEASPNGNLNFYEDSENEGEFEMISSFRDWENVVLKERDNSNASDST